MIKFLIFSSLLASCATTQNHIVQCSLNNIPVTGIFEGTIAPHLNYYEMETPNGVTFRIPISNCVIASK
jgi:hypothetical protein